MGLWKRRWLVLWTGGEYWELGFGSGEGPRMGDQKGDNHVTISAQTKNSNLLRTGEAQNQKTV